MKGIIVKIYIFLLIVCVAVLAFMFSTFNREGMQRQQTKKYQVLNDYTYNRYADQTAPVGVREEYRFTFGEIEGSYRNFIFYTAHQNVTVFVDGERVYLMRPFIANDFGKTPGCVWNSVALEDAEEGKEVRVVIYPVYESSIGVTPSFYFGEEYRIAMDVILQHLPTLLLSIIGILSGLLFAIYGIINYRNTEMDKSLMMLGCFAVIISLWKLTDDASMSLLFRNVHALYMVPYLMLHLACVPFVLFVKEQYGTRNSKIWYLPVLTSYVGLIVTLGLQLMNIRDMREMLWVIHIEIVVTIAVTFGMIIYEIRNKGLSDKIKRNLICLVICLVGVLLDIAVYYISRGMAGNMLGMLGFIIFIFAQGSNSIKDTRELINFGMQARTFERKAYHDQLTGLNNRMAYADYTGREEFSSEHCIIMVFDLNNLKKCNDTLGHEKGDIYIRECAQIIRESFQDIGQCYRMGGDEFAVLLEHVSLDVCKKRVKRMHELVAERNRKNPEIEMGIACGYELFDNRIDHDINDTSRRADKMMYREKYAMKQAQADAKTAARTDLEGK